MRCCALLSACTAAPEALVIPVMDKQMVLIADRVYAEPGLTEREHKELLDAHRTAVANVKEYFGEPRRGLPIAADPLPPLRRAPGALGGKVSRHGEPRRSDEGTVPPDMDGESLSSQRPKD